MNINRMAILKGNLKRPIDSRLSVNQVIRAINWNEQRNAWNKFKDSIAAEIGPKLEEMRMKDRVLSKIGAVGMGHYNGLRKGGKTLGCPNGFDFCVPTFSIGVQPADLSVQNDAFSVSIKTGLDRADREQREMAEKG